MLIKFETLKKNIIREEVVKIERLNYGTDYEKQMFILFDALAYKQPYDKSKEEIISKFTSIINSFDIRRVDYLRKLFPYAFRGALKNSTLHVDMNENGDWIIFSNAIDQIGL